MLVSISQVPFTGKWTNYCHLTATTPVPQHHLHVLEWELAIRLLLLMPLLFRSPLNVQCRGFFKSYYPIILFPDSMCFHFAKFLLLHKSLPSSPKWQIRTASLILGTGTDRTFHYWCLDANQQCGHPRRQVLVHPESESTWQPDHLSARHLGSRGVP